MHGSRGILWEVACSDEWDGAHVKFGAAEKVWTLAVMTLILVSIMYSVVYGAKLCIKCRRDGEEEEQRQENLETTRNLYDANVFVESFK